jgi:hypothetical protein
MGEPAKSAALPAKKGAGKIVPRERLTIFA